MEQNFQVMLLNLGETIHLPEGSMQADPMSTPCYPMCAPCEPESAHGQEVKICPHTELTTYLRVKVRTVHISALWKELADCLWHSCEAYKVHRQ